ncbi:MAG: hypothetical protein AB7O26_03980 [Planctomycetaceae bacterium]
MTSPPNTIADFVRFLVAILIGSTACPLVAAELAFVGAEGFGAETRGGTGGKILHVTRLDDDPGNPAPGSLRWGVAQRGPRIVRFRVAGNIRLAAPLVVTEPFLTIDGSDAPGDGICICDDNFIIKRSHDVIVRHVRFRRGDVRTLEAVEKAGLARPEGSAGLDCCSFVDSRTIIVDHCSLTWCCDEMFCFVRCENVTVQWCLMAEPLANPRVHPYGDRHAFAFIASASTLSLHHNLIARYVMRGPQFEVNDVRRHTNYDVKMEAINNVLFDFQRSGSRYTTGIEDHPEEAAGRKFEFQFVNNSYIDPVGRKPPIEAVRKHGVIDNLRVAVIGNTSMAKLTSGVSSAAILTDERKPVAEAATEIRAQITEQLLFTAPVPVTVESAEESLKRVLDDAGSSKKRDEVDRRIVEDVRNRRGRPLVKSQQDVGGWPELK